MDLVVRQRVGQVTEKMRDRTLSQVIQRQSRSKLVYGHLLASIANT